MGDHPVYIPTPIDHRFHEDKQWYSIRCIGSCIPVVNLIKGLASEADEEILNL